jgi:spermidine/putrescine transport system substrate-binding protein
MQQVNRRDFLAAGAVLGGAALLGGCGSSSSGGSSGGGGGSAAKTTPLSKRPDIAKEPGNMSILEWGGYEAGGTKAQTSGLWAGTPYTQEFGKHSVVYTYIVNDDQSLSKAATSGPFDIMHPCNEMLPSFVKQGLIQPWDTSLLPSFKNLNPFLVEKGQVDGKQYMIPWDWGYASLLYRSDKIAPADATGWELAWNPKYKGRISLWNGSGSNMEVAALKLGYHDMDTMSESQIAAAKNTLIAQKPLNKFYWSSEYEQMQPSFKSGDIWITYSWQDAFVSMSKAGLQVAYLNPSQGKLSWFCGYTLGAQTKNFFHAHKYAESFINHKACVQMTNLFYYGTADKTIKASEIQNHKLAKQLNIGNPTAIEASDVHLQSWQPERPKYELAWQEVLAS